MAHSKRWTVRGAAGVLLLGLSVLAGAGEPEPEYRVLTQFDQPVGLGLGPFAAPSVLIMGRVDEGKLPQESEIRLTDARGSVLEKLQPRDRGIRFAAASGSGQEIAFLSRQQLEGKGEWTLTLIRRIPFSPALAFVMSRDGSTMLVLHGSSWWLEPERTEDAEAPAIRCYDDRGKVLGELTGTEAARYLVSKAFIASKAGKIFTFKLGAEQAGGARSLACLDLALRELWSVPLGQTEEAAFDVNESAERIAVVASRPQPRCLILDFGGNLLSNIRTMVYGNNHVPRVSPDGRSIIVRHERTIGALQLPGAETSEPKEEP